MADLVRQESDYENAADYVRALKQDCDTQMRQYDVAIKEELDFCIKQNHYEYDEPGTRDSRRVKPKDPSLMNMVRHKTSQILKASKHFDVLPEDEVTDPLMAEMWKKLLMLELNDPDENYREIFTDVITGALAGRMWAAEFQSHPDCGVVAKSLDPRRFRWHPGFKSPHDKDCPWVIISDRVPLDEARRMAQDSPDFKGSLDDIKEDQAFTDTDSRTSMYAEEIRWRAGYGAGPSDSGQRYVTVSRWYQKWDKKTIKKKRRNARLLQSDERYLHCQQCGYQSPPQHAMGQDLPEQALCPACGGTMERIDALDHEDEYLKNRDGRRLVICFPHCKVVVHDGNWEFEKMRSWPAVLLKAYWNPLEPCPMSDTSYYKSLQLIIDVMYRTGYEQMLKAKGWIMAPEDDLVDAFGKPWQFSDYQDVMYYRNVTTPNAVQFFQPRGLNQDWMTLMQSVQGTFTAHQGTGDLGMTQQQSKDIAVGTVRTLVETGEIPVDNHIADFQVWLSRFLTRLAEAKMSVEDNEELVHILGPQGMAKVKLVWSAMPMVNIVVTAEPDLSQEKLDTMQKLGGLLPMLQQNPAMFQLMAKMVNLSPSLVEEAVMAQMNTPPPGPPGMPPGPPGMPPAGPNGNGMPPMQGARMLPAMGAGAM